MGAFLSDEWFAELERAGGDEPGPDALTLDVVVTAGGGEERFHARVGSGGVRFSRGPAPAADVTFTLAADDAAALAAGARSAAEVLAAGRVRVAGDLSVIAGRATDLARAADVLAAGRTAAT